MNSFAVFSSMESDCVFKPKTRPTWSLRIDYWGICRAEGFFFTMPVSPSFGDVQCILDGSLFFSIWVVFVHRRCICALEMYLWMEMYLRIGDVFANVFSLESLWYLGFSRGALNGWLFIAICQVVRCFFSFNVADLNIAAEWSLFVWFWFPGTSRCLRTDRKWKLDAIASHVEGLDSWSVFLYSI